MRVLIAGWLIIPVALFSLAGCRQNPATPAQKPATTKPAGRLVPAVVAGFERGLGGWLAERSGENAVDAPKAQVSTGDAARGENWLAISVTTTAGTESIVDVWGKVPSGDWLRFGDTLRADVRTIPGGVKATVQPYIVSPDGKESLGPQTEVTSAWKSVVWQAGDTLGNVARIGLRWRLSGDWKGRLGVDNVRVGSADALSTAYSVAYGPFGSREQASETMKTLKSAGVQSFPIYEEGWYLNLGTFSTRAAARKESQRLKQQGFSTLILVR